LPQKRQQFIKGPDVSRQRLRDHGAGLPQIGNAQPAIQAEIVPSIVQRFETQIRRGIRGIRVWRVRPPFYALNVGIAVQRRHIDLELDMNVTLRHIRSTRNSCLEPVANYSVYRYPRNEFQGIESRSRAPCPGYSLQEEFFVLAQHIRNLVEDMIDVAPHGIGTAEYGYSLDNLRGATSST
jgi:hypothetical protein